MIPTTTAPTTSSSNGGAALVSPVGPRQPALGARATSSGTSSAGLGKRKNSSISIVGSSSSGGSGMNSFDCVGTIGGISANGTSGGGSSKRRIATLIDVLERCRNRNITTSGGSNSSSMTTMTTPRTTFDMTEDGSNYGGCPAYVSATSSLSSSWSAYSPAYASSPSYSCSSNHSVMECVPTSFSSTSTSTSGGTANATRATTLPEALPTSFVSPVFAPRRLHQQRKLHEGGSSRSSTTSSSNDHLFLDRYLPPVPAHGPDIAKEGNGFGLASVTGGGIVIGGIGGIGSDGGAMSIFVGDNKENVDPAAARKKKRRDADDGTYEDSLVFSAAASSPMASITTTNTTNTTRPKTRPTSLFTDDHPSEMNKLHCYLLKDILELYYVDTSSEIAKKKAVYKPNPNANRTKTSANSNDVGDMTTDATTTHKRRSRTKTAKAMALKEAKYDDEDEAAEENAFGKKSGDDVPYEEDDATANDDDDAPSLLPAKRRKTLTSAMDEPITDAIVEIGRRKENTIPLSDATNLCAVRCKFCRKENGTGVIWVKSLTEQHLYTKVAAFYRLHLKDCEHCPPSVLATFKSLKTTQRKRGRKVFWIKSALKQGLVTVVDDMGRNVGIAFKE